jgi:hypothetical protein
MAENDPKTALITNSSIKPFDMIVALSQNEINATLSYLWAKQPTGTPTPGESFSSFNYINISNPDDGTSIVGHLKPPTVELNVEDGPSRQVLFTLSFGDDAVFEWISVDIVKKTLYVMLFGRVFQITLTLHAHNFSTPVYTSMTGWSFAFVVSLNLQAASIESLPQSVKDVLLNPEDYSVQRLLFDFTSQ